MYSNPSIFSDAFKVIQHIWIELLLAIRGFRIIPQLDKNERIVEFAQTYLGKLFLVVCFSLGLAINDVYYWQELVIVFLLLTLFPAYRSPLILLATIYWVWSNGALYINLIEEIAEALGTSELINWDTLRTDVLLSIFLFCTVFYLLAFKYRNAFGFKRPIALLIIFYLVIIAVACYLPLPEIIRTYLWTFIIVFRRFIWFFAYSLLDIHSKDPTPYHYQLGYYQAFWQGSFLHYFGYLPLPKGVGYLKNIEAKTAIELAVSQLKGIKLLYWASFLVLVEIIFNNLFYGNPGTFISMTIISYSFEIPSFNRALHASMVGNPLPWYTGWLCVYLSLMHALLKTAIIGHIIIACVRMAGFNALRNTYKPLQSKTLIEFWNRYVFYFKELLVEMFFYPTFLRYFKKWPRFRLFFATMSAAGFGNVLFHFLYSPQFFFQLGLLEAFISFQVYFFYGLLLGLGISLSQLRNQHNRGEYPWFRCWISGPLCVFSFFAIITIFDYPEFNASLTDHLRFSASLFGFHF